VYLRALRVPAPQNYREAGGAAASIKRGPNLSADDIVEFNQAVGPKKGAIFWRDLEEQIKDRHQNQSN
jgi:hypothetical protein